MSRRRGPGHGPDGLTDEERVLWERAADEVAPLKRKSRVHAAAEKGAEAAPAGAKVAPAWRAATSPASVPAAQPAKPAPMASFDARKERKIRTGAVRIERRVDLHGMRQREAHAELRRFLLSAHAAGCRLVLVITGKGAPRRRRDDGSFDPFGDQEPGVLRREVPRWLADPELRGIIVSHTQAAVQHGGEGAIYVHLRRERDRLSESS